MQLPLVLTEVIDKALEAVYGLGPVFEPTVVLGKKVGSDHAH